MWPPSSRRTCVPSSRGRGLTTYTVNWGSTVEYRRRNLFPIWWKKRIQRGRNRKFPLAEDFLAEREAHPLDDAFWASKRPILENIEVPALICASGSPKPRP